MTGHDRVRALFHPRSIALVGATDNSGWSLSTFFNLSTHGFAGSLYLVNPGTEVVHGQRAYGSLSAIPEPVDLAFVMVPTVAVLDVVREGAGLGIRNYVILTAGFAEMGGEGRRLERELADFARHNELMLLGPNGNGFVNAAAGITPYGLPIQRTPVPGGVGFVLQSGALASSVLSFAQARNLGISLLTSMGNETMLSVTDVVDYLVDDPSTKVIALFLEQVRNPPEFARVVQRAARAGKPVVALKIGSSELASSTAEAHTGALVGDDDVVDAAFRRLGVLRVRSLEALIITAGLLAEVGPLPGRRIGVVTPSGGGSEIIADRAAAEGLELPSFAPETAAELEAIMPAFATVQNPLDVTGYYVVDRSLLGRALDIVATDPGIDAVMLLIDLPRFAPGDPAQVMATFTATADRIRNCPRPVVAVSTVLTDVTEFGRTVQDDTGFPHLVGGIDQGITAISLAASWAPPVPRPSEEPFDVLLGEDPEGTWTERRAAALLADNGVPVVPAELVHDEDAAVGAAEGFGYPVVLKAVADDLVHKSDIGGVRIGLAGPEDVREAFREVRGLLGASAATGVGALIQPQRGGGVELLVGILRDPEWGLTLTVGLGGVWTEVLRDSAIRLLPVDRAEIREALDGLRGSALLRGARGSEPADLPTVVSVVERIARIATALGDRLESLEVNPLLVDGSRVEALDAVITWRG